MWLFGELVVLTKLQLSAAAQLGLLQNPALNSMVRVIVLRVTGFEKWPSHKGLSFTSGLRPLERRHRIRPFYPSASHHVKTEPSLWVTPFHWDCMWQCLGTACLCVLWDDNSLLSTYGHWTEMVESSPVTEFLGDIICCRICVLYQQTQTWSPSWPALWPFSHFLPVLLYAQHKMQLVFHQRTKHPSNTYKMPTFSPMDDMTFKIKLCHSRALV